MIKYSKITFKSRLVLPYKFLGSTIRGVLGQGLKKTVCINPSGECEGCFAKEGCLFYDFYEKANPKYRLNIEPGGSLNFDYYLFEEYASNVPYVIRAVYSAFKEIGITKKRIKTDFLLFVNDSLVYDGKFREFENKALEFKPKEYKPNPYILFKTPLRIKQNGQFVKDDVSFETILRSVWHRKAKLKNEPIQKLPFTPEYKVKSSNFSFTEVRRYSNRQKTAMNIGGIIGGMELEGVDEKSFYLLSLGELIGVGKQVSFGLGRYEIF